MNLTAIAEKTYRIHDDWPVLKEMRPGDRIRVKVEIQEGAKKRIQNFEGILVFYKKGGLNSSLCVRKVSFGVGVERIFPVHAPCIKGIEVLTQGHVRRARLYYLRGLKGKAARIRSRDRSAVEVQAPTSQPQNKAE